MPMIRWHPRSCPRLTVELALDECGNSWRPTCSSCCTSGPTVQRAEDPNYPESYVSVDQYPITPPGSIRVLQFDPDTPGDVIHCELEVVHTFSNGFHETPEVTKPYDAISYTWTDETGDATPKFNIYLGPEWIVFSVTANCFHVLRRARHYAQVVWIDSVCIDQEDDDDKSRQVSLMKSIYASAERVLAFVGGLQQNDMHGPAGRLPHGQPDHTILNHILQQRYFQRVWIIQELLMARDVLMFYGPFEFSYKQLRGFVRTTRLGNDQIPSCFRIITDPRLLISDIGLLSGYFLSILVAARSTKASNPKDKVIALLGLLEMVFERDFFFGMDYKQHFHSVLFIAARRILLFSGTEILEHAEDKFGQVSCVGCGSPGYVDTDGVTIWDPEHRCLEKRLVAHEIASILGRMGRLRSLLGNYGELQRLVEDDAALLDFFKHDQGFRRRFTRTARERLFRWVNRFKNEALHCPYSRSLPSWVPNWAVNPQIAMRPSVILYAGLNTFFIKGPSKFAKTHFTQPPETVDLNRHGGFAAEGILLDTAIGSDEGHVVFSVAGRVQVSKDEVILPGDTLWLFAKVTMPVILRTVRAPIQALWGEHKAPPQSVGSSIAVRTTFIGKCQVRKIHIGPRQEAQRSSSLALTRDELLNFYRGYARVERIEIDR